MLRTAGPRRCLSMRLRLYPDSYMLKQIGLAERVMAEPGNPQSGWFAGTARAPAGSRHFMLWVPPTPEPDRAWPLLLLLHGCMLDAEEMAAISGMNQVAEANRFLVLYPEQTRLANLMKCWNWFLPGHQARDAGEPSILAAAVRQVATAHLVDPNRIYVAGASAGGAMASILAATYPDLFAALAVAAGAEFKAAASFSEALTAMKRGGPDPGRQGQLAFQAMQTGLERRRRSRMPLIAFHGAADAIVNPLNAGQTVNQWKETNALLAAAHGEGELSLTEKIIAGTVPGGYDYQRHIFIEPDGRPLLENWLVQGLGHAWSGSPKASRYGDPKGPNISQEIWRFFSQVGALHPQPAQVNK